MWTVVCAALVSFAFGGAQRAVADIGVWKVSQTSGAPGETVDLFVACGGCVPGIPGGAKVGPRLPVSMLPVGRADLYRRQCPTGPCTPTAPAPPAGPPYVPLGIAEPLRGDQRSLESAHELGIPIPATLRRHGASSIRQWLANMNWLRFQVPETEPGAYKYVVYCAGCIDGPEGGLIQMPSGNDRQRAILRREDEEVFRILTAATEPVTAEEGGEKPWLLAGVGLAVGLAGVVVALRRRRAAG